MIYELKELGKAAPLFGQWQESLKIGRAHV